MTAIDAALELLLAHIGETKMQAYTIMVEWEALTFHVTVTDEGSRDGRWEPGEPPEWVCESMWLVLSDGKVMRLTYDQDVSQEVDEYIHAAVCEHIMYGPESTWHKAQQRWLEC